MKTSIYTILIYFFITTAQAQTYIDIFKFEWDEGFVRPYENGSGQARFYDLSADLTLPVVLRSGNALLTGLNAERTRVLASGQRQDELYHGLSLKLGVNLRHSATWSGSYILLPRYASADCCGMDRRDFQLGLFFLLKRQRVPDKNIRFGLYANTELFGPFFVPLFGYYRKTERTEINLLLPLSAEATYRLLPDWRVGFKFQGIVKTFSINQGGPAYLAKANNELGLISYLHFGRLLFSIQAGTSVGRSLRIYEEDDKLLFAVSALKFGDDRRQLNNDFRDGFFLKLGVLYRVQVE